MAWANANPRLSRAGPVVTYIQSMRSFRWHFFCAIPVLILAMSIAIGGLVLTVHARTDGRFYSQAGAIPARPVAIIFGAGVRPDGGLSPMLAGRVDGGIDLYREGRVTKLLMTGDNGRVDYDEVGAMRDYAVRRGVPTDDIVRDHAGFSTYESCYRARAIFGVESAILVTQRYHLARAIFTCSNLGIEAIGFGVPDWGLYNSTLLFRYSAREVASTVKAVIDVKVTHPSPTFLGQPEPIG